MSTYRARSARDADAAARAGHSPLMTRDYADMLERHALELAARFPDQADYFLGRTLSEALAGNDGD